MIYDCFTFFNEIDLLELRLLTLGEVVDCFILVEATTTFTGVKKPLFYNENKSRFSEYAGKIIHVVVEDSPAPTSETNVWNVEQFQRNAIVRGLRGATPNSAIIISDADEIAHPVAVKDSISNLGLTGFPTRLYYYYVNCRQNETWNGPVMCRMADMPTPHEMRFSRNCCSTYAEPIGWHFSFLGGEQAILDKLAAFSETQVNNTATRDPTHLRRCLKNGDDLFFRQGASSEKRFVEIDDTYPECMEGWLERHPEYLKVQSCLI
jgi:beta-1,4-mannosyl-glycoprotein beta-1,4-N-acetylglucosaminyltransferase